jgi:hypothetical protein
MVERSCHYLKELPVPMFKRNVDRHFYQHPGGAFKQAPPAFAVSRTRRMHPLWRYLWPYRSARHFLLTMLAAIAVWTIQGVFLSYYIPHYFNPFSLLALLIVVPLTIPYDELPAKVRISTAFPAHHFLSAIGQELRARGYALQAPASRHAGHLRFAPQAQARFAPMCWIEQEVDVWQRDEATIDVYGSNVDLSKLIHRLGRRYRARPGPDCIAPQATAK